MQNRALVMNPTNLLTEGDFMGQIIEMKILSIQTWGMIKH